MPAVYQQTMPFTGDVFGIFSLFKDRPGVFFLDSSLHRANARFSYIGFEPFTMAQGSLPAVKKVFDKYRMGRQKLGFPAGAVGYLGYDGTVSFGFYDTIVAADHIEKKLVISGLDRNRIKDILAVVSMGGLRETRRSGPVDTLKFKSNFTKTQYIQAVRQALEHIRRGDIYQINLSHRVQAKVSNWRKYAGPAGIYQHLRRAFPSEFGAYIDDGQKIILSASPERFLRLQKDIAQVKPMKGTRPRGKTKAQDRKFKDELKKSPKEIAELLMVTDLERNDLGRVCAYGSVRVSQMRAIETYKSVFQATSTVEGRLRKDCDQFDLLQAAFPSGSVTGCPKIEAMKIINKLERGSRGLYTGALGYMSFSGDMDFNVMIRTMFLNKNDITFHVGGGIVADSRPEAEWQETWVKAQPLMDTLRRVFS